MAWMTIEQVAEYLELEQTQVQFLLREHILVAKGRTDLGQDLFDEGDVVKYQHLAKRISEP